MHYWHDCNPNALIIIINNDKEFNSSAPIIRAQFEIMFQKEITHRKKSK